MCVFSLTLFYSDYYYYYYCAIDVVGASVT